LVRRIPEYPLPLFKLLNLKLLPPPPRPNTAGVCVGQLSIWNGTEGAPAVSDLSRGTGGTDLVKFLRGVRDQTSEAAFSVGCGAP
jgi:hypothetical protein